MATHTTIVALLGATLAISPGCRCHDPSSQTSGSARGGLFDQAGDKSLGQTQIRPPGKAYDKATARPRLVVLVVIDQLRGDELTKHDRLFRDGLRRLMDEGRWYTRALHTHARTETATGHATIATGLVPRYHGVVDKTIFSTPTGELLRVCDFGTGPCDPDVLMAETLGDRLKGDAANAQVVALAHKKRSAMLLGGHRADLVAWGVPFDQDPEAAMSGRRAAGQGLPKWLRLFRQQTISPDRINRIWELPRLPAPYDLWRDDAPSELSPGHGVTFPHRLPDTDDLNQLYWSWFTTPDNDRVLVDTAQQVARRLELGRDEAPDLLAISLAGFDAIGHHFGPDSLERVAALTELDRHLGDLLTSLSGIAGSRLVIALTSDHGTAPTPWAAQRAGHKSERIKPETLGTVAQNAITAALGPGDHVRAVAFPFITLKKLGAERRTIAVQAAVTALEAIPVVHRVLDMTKLDPPRDELERLFYANAYPGRSGDLGVVLVPYSAQWQKYRGKNGAEHGTPWEYDRHVPVILWGDGIAAARVDQKVAVIDLTRTLGDLLGLPPDPRGGAPLP